MGNNSAEIRLALRPVWAAIGVLAVTMVLGITFVSVGIARALIERDRHACEVDNVRAVAVRDAVDKLVPDRSVLEPETRKAFRHLLDVLDPEDCV